MYDRSGRVSKTIEASGVSDGKRQLKNTKRASITPKAAGIAGGEVFDYSRKMLHLSWHPRQEMVAVASMNNLFLYHSSPSSL